MAGKEAKKAVAMADAMLTQRNVEAELFRGRRLSEKSNREKLDAFAAELVREHRRRRTMSSPPPPGIFLPNVDIKQAATPPRLSLSSAATTASSSSGATAGTMPSPASQEEFSRH